MSSFQVRVYKETGGYLAVIDGLGVVRAAKLTDVRNEASRFLEKVVAGAFPDRPPVQPAGAREVLRFRISVNRE
ncbi:MAG: hypothetical protein WB778_03445, partial [Thermoplasmata archaeon]